MTRPSPSRAHRVQLVLGVLVAVFSVSSAASAQQRWSVDAAVVVAKDFRHDNAPALGPVGGQVRVFRPRSGDWVWGAALTYYRFGRFDYDFAPNFYADRSALVAGVRRRRLGLLMPALYGELGLGLVVGMEDLPDADISRDPGVSGYLGVGAKPHGGGPFAELGLHGIAVSGELTDTGGVYLVATLGVLF